MHTGSANTLEINHGSLRVDSVLFIPERGNNDWHGQYGNVRINTTTGNFEFRKNGQWIEVAQTEAPKYKVQDFYGASSYQLQYTPIEGTVKVAINGQEQNQAAIHIFDKSVTLQGISFSVDGTDVVKITYFYKPDE